MSLYTSYVEIAGESTEFNRNRAAAAAVSFSPSRTGDALSDFSQMEAPPSRSASHAGQSELPTDEQATESANLKRGAVCKFE